VTEEKKGVLQRDTHGYSEYLNRVLTEPTSAEVSRLTFEPLREIRIFFQHEYNHFAHLLNRGSSLE
jgi:hypothetical protein